MLRKLIVAILISAVVFFFFFQFYRLLKKRVVLSDLKALTEKRIGEFLHAKVHVDQISIGILKHISVKGLAIDPAKSKYPFFVGARNIVVRYDLMSFLTRNFKFPTEVLLDAPRLTLEALRDPKTLLDFDLLKSERGIFTRFELEEGEIKLPWFRPGQELSLTSIQARAEPRKGNVFHIHLKSNVSGAARGALKAQGKLDPAGKKFYLEAALENIDFTPESEIPVTRLSGALEIENDTLRMKKLSLLLRGIPCELEGEIRRAFSETPEVAFSLRTRGDQLKLDLKVRADFQTETLSGAFQFSERKYFFTGSLRGRLADFEVPSFQWNDRYQGSGRLDLKRGVLRVRAEHEGERGEIEFRIARFAGKVTLKLDHVKRFGFDLVTNAALTLEPDEAAWAEGIRKFLVRLETDYLIFQYQPLRDFQASASLSPDGWEDILARWGRVSELRGRIPFYPEPAADLTLRVSPIALDELQSLGTHPLPMSLQGNLEGKLEIKGPLARPHLEGAFTIENGKIGDLVFDRAMIFCTGELPYLLLRDSKVLKGNIHFLLKGGLDFKLRNFLKGAQVVNAEHVVIWKGLELSQELDQSEFLSAASSPAAQAETSLGSRASLPRKVGAEYRLTKGASLQVTAEEDQHQKELLTAGPKLKF